MNSKVFVRLGFFCACYRQHLPTGQVGACCHNYCPCLLLGERRSLRKTTGVWHSVLLKVPAAFPGIGLRRDAYSTSVVSLDFGQASFHERGLEGSVSGTMLTAVETRQLV